MISAIILISSFLLALVIVGISYMTDKYKAFQKPAQSGMRQCHKCEYKIFDIEHTRALYLFDGRRITGRRYYCLDCMYCVYVAPSIEKH